MLQRLPKHSLKLQQLEEGQRAKAVLKIDDSQHAQGPGFDPQLCKNQQIMKMVTDIIIIIFNIPNTPAKWRGLDRWFCG